MHFDFAENNVQSVTRRAATFILYLCPSSHNFASVYMLDYIDKNYSMRKTVMCGAMKPVSLLFDQLFNQYNEVLLFGLNFILITSLAQYKRIIYNLSRICQ